MLFKLRAYVSLMRLDKPIGILLLLWPTLIALWFASNGNPNIKVLIIFVLGVVVMRSAGCVVNDYADRDIDLFVARTKHRPITSGLISPHEARLLFTILILISFVLVMHLNKQTIWLSVLALILAVLYPFAKRFTNYPQLLLGMAFSCSIPMAYTAQNASINLETGLLYVANLCWVVAYDTEYAMADRQDDLQLGIKSTAITFGSYDKAIVFLLQSITILSFILLGIKHNFNLNYYLPLLGAMLLAIYQQYVIKDYVPTACIQAFKNNNYFGMLLFLAVVLGVIMS
jgi:4-hydroxybenzoate polyprenyltransferase